MAAETLQSDAVKYDEATFKPFPRGNIGVRVAEIEVGADLEVGDIFEMIPVYAGETVYDVILQADDIDTNGTPTVELDVGDGDVQDRYIDGSTIGQTGGIERLANAVGTAPSATEFPKTYTAKDTIDVEVTAVQATGAAGTLRLIAFVA